MLTVLPMNGGGLYPEQQAFSIAPAMSAIHWGGGLPTSVPAVHCAPTSMAAVTTSQPRPSSLANLGNLTYLALEESLSGIDLTVLLTSFTSSLPSIQLLPIQTMGLMP